VLGNGQRGLSLKRRGILLSSYPIDDAIDLLMA